MKSNLHHNWDYVAIPFLKEDTLGLVENIRCLEAVFIEVVDESPMPVFNQLGHEIVYSHMVDVFR